ncbi:MAG: isoprenylcysteine carboxylmethyltransferase family protein [Chloroflexi bacterium]|nr:isoprenylcysteine carboxylmethyltransferase family protein [Chloroflexota bacterium]
MPTTETFWDQMAAYNDATLFVQGVLTIAGVIVTYLVFAKHDAKANALMRAFLTCAFAWNGVVFFILFSKAPFSNFFGAPLFILIALLFALEPFPRTPSGWSVSRDGCSAISTLLRAWQRGGVEMQHEAKETLGYVVNGLSIALFFYLASTLDVPDSPLAVTYIGWVLFGFGILLIVWSLAMLISNQGAGLIESGVYGLVRHPMYLGAMLLFLSWIFFCPHWIIILISSINVAIVYWFILQGELQNIVKFGDAYRRYMEAVPRINLLIGLLRLLQGK